MSVTERIVAQGKREISLTTPLGEDVLGLRRLEAREELGRPFSYGLELLSADPDIRPQDLLGENVTIRLRCSGGGERIFNGHICRFELLGYEGQLAHYRADVVPWLWFLGRTSDCRIFQSKSVPEIVTSVFREHGFTDFDEALTESYEPFDYVVQYRETDLNFVSRLLEQEGIYYFFRHEDGKHTLVLCDSYSCHEASAGYEQIPFYPRGEDVVREQESLWSWLVSQEVQPGACALNDFDFKSPRKSLRAVCSKPQEHALADLEVYDYPGGYMQSGGGARYSRIRIEERQAEYEVVRGEGNARGLNVGALFELTHYPREDQNREYLVISASYEMEATPFESAAAMSQPEYRCRFAAIDARTPFRPRRVTPKPVVQGPQTARVVGKAGEEIWTEKHGRVKVQFHWDRYGKADENSSCWVRVSQPWAGKSWGAVAIPRIGQEVIVECLEGDPDRPIITGRVYNGDQMPPYALPDNQTQSGIKSQSTPGGGLGNRNEICFEDKKGSEEFFEHAEKNMTVLVKGSRSETVGGSVSTSAGGSISRASAKDISRTADGIINDKAAASYSLLTNQGIHLKTVHAAYEAITSSWEKAKEKLKSGDVSGVADSAKTEAKSGMDAANQMAAQASKAADSADSAASHADSLNAALTGLGTGIAAGAASEVLADKLLAAVGAADSATAEVKEVLEGLLPEIPSIVMWAMKNYQVQALWQIAMSAKYNSVSIESEKKDVSIKAKKEMNLEASEKNFNVTAGKKDVNVKADEENVNVTAKKKVSIKAEDEDLVIEAGQKKLFVKAAKQIFLKCGKASISLSESGNIVISGEKVNINGKAPVQVKGKPIKLN